GSGEARRGWVVDNRRRREYQTFHPWISELCQRIDRPRAAQTVSRHHDWIESGVIQKLDPRCNIARRFVPALPQAACHQRRIIILQVHMCRVSPACVCTEKCNAELRQLLSDLDVARVVESRAPAVNPENPSPARALR